MTSSPMTRIATLLLLTAGSAAAVPPPRFPPGSVWHTSVATAPLHPQSAQMIATLDALGGWGVVDGVNHRFHIDFSIPVITVGAGETPPEVPVVPHAVYEDYTSPDCEAPGTAIPLPPYAAFEDDLDGLPLRCDNESNDCHLLVVAGSRLYEVYSGNFDGAQIDALCLVQWELDAVYPPEGRGEHCTSADAAGFPMAPLMPNADEVAAAVGLPDADLGHAIRFILPNARMASLPDGPDSNSYREPLYVRPASHAGGPAGPETTVPYGARLRLRADFPLQGYNPAARVLLRTMQRYGIVLSDGGNVALTFASDVNTQTDWATLGITPQVFWNGSAGDRQPVRVTDFEVVDTGPRVMETYDCVRAPPPDDGYVFRNGFE